MQFSTEEKAMWLEDWRQSGKSAWAYAKENGLVPQTFVRWTKLENEPNIGFVEVSSGDLASCSIMGAAKSPTEQRLTEIMQNPHYPQQKILIEKGDVKIHIPCGIDRSELLSIMGSLWRAL